MVTLSFISLISILFLPRVLFVSFFPGAIPARLLSQIFSLSLSRSHSINAPSQLIVDGIRASVATPGYSSPSASECVCVVFRAATPRRRLRPERFHRNKSTADMCSFAKFLLLKILRGSRCIIAYYSKLNSSDLICIFKGEHHCERFKQINKKINPQWWSPL